MLKYILSALLAASLLMLGGCDEKVILHCDGCNKEIQVDADSGMDESWILLCQDCDIELKGLE